MRFELPNPEEWNAIYAKYELQKMSVSDGDFNYIALEEDDISRLYEGNQLFTWVVNLSNRLIQTRWSFIVSIFLYGKEIPDTEWVISPGRKGQSTEYFPHFDNENHIRKAQFDYFADIFYYKFFSALDNLGHVLNHMYVLEVNQPTFYKVVKKLKNIRPNLFTSIDAVVQSESYNQMKTFRHMITHNELPGHIRSTTARIKDDRGILYTFGTGEYTTSTQIIENMVKIPDIFDGIMKAIREQITEDLNS